MAYLSDSGLQTLITKIKGAIPSIPGISVTATGTGNVVASVTASGHTLTVNRTNLPTIPDIIAEVVTGAPANANGIAAISVDSSNKHKLKITKARFFTDLESSGTGNAVTDITVDGAKLKVSKDATYLTTTTAGNTYLKKTDATSTYLSKTDAGNTYLKKTDLAGSTGQSTTTAMTQKAVTDTFYTKAQANAEFLEASQLTTTLPTTGNGSDALTMSQKAICENFYTKANADAAIASAINTGLGGLTDLKYAIWPTSTPPTGTEAVVNTIYLVPTGTSGTNQYEEYLAYDLGESQVGIERLGLLSVDLTPYLKKADLAGSTGGSTTTAMTQKAVTDTFLDKTTATNTYLKKADAGSTYRKISDSYTKTETYSKTEANNAFLEASQLVQTCPASGDGDATKIMSQEVVCGNFLQISDATATYQTKMTAITNDQINTWWNNA